MDRLTDAYKIWHLNLKKLQRESRYVIGLKIDNLFLEIIEYIIFAFYAPKIQKLGAIQKASTKLDFLKHLLKTAWEIKILESKKYLEISVPLSEIGKQLGGWLKQLQKEAPLTKPKGE